MNSKFPLAIDLFAGAGGFSEGLEKAGIRVGLAQELHPQPALSLAFNHLHSQVLVGDLRSINLGLMDFILRDKFGEKPVDIIVGGPPCQGFSTAGKKQKDDPRNSLFSYYCKVVEYFRPKIVVLENVPGFKKMHNGDIYREAIASFSSLGYSLRDTILNACDYGVPQRRMRFIMVGIRQDLNIDFCWPSITHLNPEKNTGQDLFDDLRTPAPTVEEAISDLAFVQPGFEASRYELKSRSQYQMERRAGCAFLFNHLATRHREKAVEMFSHIPEGGTISQVPRHLKSAKRTMARLDRGHISNAVLALPDDLIHYEQNRILSVREMARLQSFDDDYVFIGKRTSGFRERRIDVPQYTQVGNAVPPLLSYSIGKEIMKSLGISCSDIREKKSRLARHSWVRGSSGFAGYVLGSEADFDLFDTEGKKLELPIDDTLPRVIDQANLNEWKAQKRIGMKKQWAPGVNSFPLTA